MESNYIIKIKQQNKKEATNAKNNKNMSFSINNYLSVNVLNSIKRCRVAR